MLVPSRVRVLILGGGIHGVGVLHDLASRGWSDVLLVEKKKLAAATSRQSTKLIHGGLRYLKNIGDYGLVREGLRERQLLLELAPDLVKPVELLFPVFKNNKSMPSWMVSSGLRLYDFLSAGAGFSKHKKISFDEAKQKIPYLDTSKMKAVYSFWDGQTDDLLLTRKVASCAKSLGVEYLEDTLATKVEKNDDGWLVSIKNNDNEYTISCKYLVNTLSPWADIFLKQNNIEPIIQGINVKGSHLILKDIGLKSGVFLQSPQDHRELFLLPWKGKTLLGTTENLYKNNPDELRVLDSEVDYMLECANYYLAKPLETQDIEAKFCGLRWLVPCKSGNIHKASRHHEITEHRHENGVLYTLYGGKLTSYREISKQIGDRIFSDYGDTRASKTHLKEFWQNTVGSTIEDSDTNILSRFS